MTVHAFSCTKVYNFITKCPLVLVHKLPDHTVWINGFLCEMDQTTHFTSLFTKLSHAQFYFRSLWLFREVWHKKICASISKGEKFHFKFFNLSSHPPLVRFLRELWPFLNPTIEVVTFRLHGWCMLGVVFLLPAFTCLWHECQDLLSLCDGMHVCTD